MTDVLFKLKGGKTASLISTHCFKVELLPLNSASMHGSLKGQICIGGAGPPGQDGADAPGAIVQYPAGENLSSGRVVIIDNGEAFYFQPSNGLHAGRAFGVTTSSALSGVDVSIQLTGEVIDAGFSGLTDSTCWVGNNGQAQTSIPTGTVQKAGIGVGANKLRIDFSIQITTI